MLSYDHDLPFASQSLADGVYRSVLSVPDMRCHNCIRKVEQGLIALKGVRTARVNLSTKQVTIDWEDIDGPPELSGALLDLGFASHIDEGHRETTQPELKRLIKALAVAGFAAANIMMFSIAVWAGAGAQTRQLFHLVSAVIAFPTLIYSGRIFYQSAWRAVCRGRTNMDVPITIGVMLAFALSAYDTIIGGAHAYFDASVTLLLFLLIGRTLDHYMKDRARQTVSSLRRLIPASVNVMDVDGKTTPLAVSALEPGMKLRLDAGARTPVDVYIERGEGELDLSMITGESDAERADIGKQVPAGALLVSGAVTAIATSTSATSFLSRMIDLMDGVEHGRHKYRRVADRLSEVYTPFVHLASALAFLGWLVLGGGVHQALTVAISVLIITCPCALGLAVPMVQVMAARRLYEAGVLVKDGTALERLTEIDTVLLDKTGTLTMAEIRLANPEAADRQALSLAARMALGSAHPHARALARHHVATEGEARSFEDVREVAGNGIEARAGEDVCRLGRAEWALGVDASEEIAAGGGQTVLSRNGVELARFTFEEALYPDVEATVNGLHRDGFAVEIVSGDRTQNVERIGASLKINALTGDMRPADKMERLVALEAQGRRVLMIGDGLNDAAILANAYVSMAPSSAADIGRNAADFVFLRPGLSGARSAIEIAQQSARLVRQNVGLSIGYNLIAVPIALAGFVTPLLAAIAMSASSLLVVANAMRMSKPGRAAAS